jgi:DUF1009 family protein
MEGSSVFIIYQILYDYDYHLPKMNKICKVLAHLVKTEIKKVVLWTNLKNKSCWVNQVESIKVVTLTCLCLHLCAYQDQEKNDDHLP